MSLNSVYDNGGIIGQVMNLGSTESYSPPISVSYLGITEDTGATNPTSFTVSTTGLTSSDTLILAYHSEITSTTYTSPPVTGITVNGSSATIDATGPSTSPVTNIGISAIARISGITASSVTVSVTVDSGFSILRSAVAAYRVPGQTSLTVLDTAEYVFSGTSTSQTLTTDVENGGLVIYDLSTGDENDTATWSGATETYDFASSELNSHWTGAYLLPTSDTTGYVETITLSGAINSGSGLAVSYAAPDGGSNNKKNSGIWSLDAVFNYLKSINVDFEVIYGGFSSVSSGARNVSYPSTVNAGDLLIVTGSQNNSANVVPTGWNSHSNAAFEFCYSKVATGSETGSLSITNPSAVEGVAQLILIRPSGAILTDFFQSHTGGFIASGSISYTAQASAGDFDLYLLHAWNAATRTLSTSPSNMNLISSTNTLHRADFYEAKDIGGETISTSYTNSINQRSDHFAFIKNGHTSSINRINLVADPLDMNAGFFTDGARCTLSRDTTTTKSPLGGVPIKMETTGSADPFIRTFDASQYNIDTAAIGETWEVRVYAKASTTTDIAIFIFGATATGTYLTSDFSGESFTVGTEWQEFRKRHQFSTATVARIQSRLDGPNAGTNGISVWFDGFQIYKIS